MFNLQPYLGLTPSASELEEMVELGVRYLTKRFRIDKLNAPKILITLGSGMQGLVNDLQELKALPYKVIQQDLQFWPISKAPGHDNGQLCFGYLRNRPVAIFKGRWHPYEGFPGWQLSMPYRIMARLGIETAILTNAVGGLNAQYKKHQVVVANGFMNLCMPLSPMLGDVTSWEQPFTVPTLDERLIKLALDTAYGFGIERLAGVYAQVMGRHYETIPDGNALRRLGADTVGMSVAHEALILAHQKKQIRILAIHGITDMVPDGASHNEEVTSDIVLEAARVVDPKMRNLLKAIVSEI